MDLGAACQTRLSPHLLLVRIPRIFYLNCSAFQHPSDIDSRCTAYDSTLKLPYTTTVDDVSNIDRFEFLKFKPVEVLGVLASWRLVFWPSGNLRTRVFEGFGIVSVSWPSNI